jgi:hypothetical protein
VRPCTLSPSKLLGMPGLTLEGCDTCRGVITSGVKTGGGGDAFCCLYVTHDGYKFIQSLIHGSGGLHLLIEPLLHLLEKFVIHSKRVDDFQRLLWRGNRG